MPGRPRQPRAVGDQDDRVRIRTEMYPSVQDEHHTGHLVGLAVLKEELTNDRVRRWLEENDIFSHEGTC